MDRKLALTIQFAAMDRLSGTMRQIVGLGDKGATSLAKMKREARDLNGQLSRVRSEMAGASGNVTELVNRERALESAIARVNRQADRQKKLLQIDNKTARIQAQADAYKSSGRDNMVAGATLLAPFIFAGREAMNFSSGMVDIQQKAALTNRETQAMANNILAAARAAHQLPESMRESVDILSGFGMDPRQAVQLAKPIGRLGTAFKVDLADGAAAAYANFNNLKVPLKEIGTAFDIMAAGGNKGAFEVKNMARWFPTLTAQLQALGQTGTPAVADLTAALQVAMNTAGSADEAANNINNLLGKINSPTVINAFKKKFGVDLPAAMKRARDEGKTTMEAFADIAQKATGGDLTKLGWVVEDRQAQMGLLALIQNMESYRTIRAEISKGSAGTVDAAFSQREMQDASISWTDFNSTLQRTGIIFGTTLLPTITRVMGTFNSVLSAVGDWAQANPRLASTILTLIAGMAAARVGIGALQFAFGSILGPMGTVWGLWQKYRTLGTIAAVFPRVAKAFGILRTAAIFLGQGFMRAGLMMLANPIVLIITAIIAAVGLAAYLIYKHWDTISAAFNTGVAWVRKSIAGLPDWLKSLGGRMMQGLLMAINPMALAWKLIEVARNGVSAFKNFLGIKSPSRLFMAMGGHVTDGLAIGLQRNAGRPIAAMRGLADDLAGTAGNDNGLMPIRAKGQMAVGGASAEARGGDTYQITVQQQPGEDGEALARRIVDIMKRERANERRGAYRDA